MNVLSIDIDYITTNEDFAQVVDLFCSSVFLNKNAQVKFAQYHVDIVDFLHDNYEEFFIVNVDLHHDIIYDEIVDPAEIRNDLVDSGNWLGWACAHRRIKKYIWCKNDNSEAFDAELSKAFSDLYSKGKNYDVIDARNVIFSSKLASQQLLNENYLKFKPKIEVEHKIKDYFFDIKYDKIFVCLSPDYTHKEKYFYYDALKNIYGNFKKAENQKKISKQNRA